MPADLPAASPDAIEPVIERCLQGDQSAWDLIVRQHWRKVFNVAYKFVGRHDEAEDLAQDIFLKVFKSLDTFDRRANFQTWLISVSRNLCIDHYRSTRKEREAINRDIDADLALGAKIPLAETPTIIVSGGGKRYPIRGDIRYDYLKQLINSLPVK